MRMAIVAGRVVAENGRILTVDEAAMRAEVAAEWPHCLAAYASTSSEATRLMPAYRRLYDRLAGECRLHPLARLPSSASSVRHKPRTIIAFRRLNGR